MVQNKIMDSYLSEYAKLCYCALRRSIVHKTGFTFVNTAPIKDDQRNLMQFMSVGSKNTVANALKELKHFRVIDIGNYNYKGIPKNIYVFLQDDEWKLPVSKEDAKKYEEYVKKQKKERKEKKDAETKINEQIQQKQKDGKFIFTYGKHKGLTMEEVYEIDSAFVYDKAKNAKTDGIKKEAQKVIDEMEQIPF